MHQHFSWILKLFLQLLVMTVIKDQKLFFFFQTSTTSFFFESWLHFSMWKRCSSSHRNRRSSSLLSPYSPNHSPFPNQPGREQGGLGSLCWREHHLYFYWIYQARHGSLSSQDRLQLLRQEQHPSTERGPTHRVPAQLSQPQNWLNTDHTNFRPGIQTAPCNTV